MTAMTVKPRPSRRGVLADLAAAWASARRTERVCYLVGVLLILVAVFHAGVFLIRGGPLTGPVSWRKPMAFGFSFGLILMTVTWVTSYLRIHAAARAALLGVFAVDCVAEVAGITVQAWRHVPSHFNMETATNRSISMMLAVGGGVLIVVLVTFAVSAFRGRPDQRPSLRLALRAGFATLLVGLGSGAAMIARGVTLTRTGHQQLAYRLGGFLIPVHAVSLHGIVVLPVVAWLVGRAAWPEARRVRVVALATTAYAAAIVGGVGRVAGGLTPGAWTRGKVIAGVASVVALETTLRTA